VRRRSGALRDALRAGGLDALLLSSAHALRYYAGFTGTSGLAVVTPAGAWFLTDPRYREQARAEVRGMRRIVASGTLTGEIAARGLLQGCRRAGFEEEQVTADLLAHLRRSARGTRFVPAGTPVEAPMLRKDTEELAAIRRAIGISERVLDEVLGLLRPGLREREVAAEISHRQRLYGADGDAFEPIVAAGARSALPHARASAGRIKAGEPLLLDFGCTVAGYRSDLTRTVVLGRAPARLRALHAAVLAAQEAAMAAVRPGTDGRTVDAAARGELRRRGLERHFVHSLGHGIGLRIHEGPRLSARSTDPLAEGEVVTIEPGVYLPGFGGVRIEDDVLVTGRGCRRLTRSPRDLLVIA
jgi:Xaa-Pro aminopeptidase